MLRNLMSQAIHFSKFNEKLMYEIEIIKVVKVGLNIWAVIPGGVNWITSAYKENK